jgi:hypothetical protein
MVADMSERSTFIDLKKISLKFVRKGSNHETTVDYKCNDAILASLTVSLNDRGEFKSNSFKWADAAARCFDLSRTAELKRAHLSPQLQEEHRIYSQSIQDLLSAITRIESAAVGQVQKQADWLQQKSSELDGQLKERKDALQKEYDAMHAELVRRQEDLAKEKSELDTRRNTAARRALLSDLRSVITQDFVLPAPTARRRWIIHSLCVAVLFGSGWLAYQGSDKLLKMPQFDWHYLSIMWGGLVIFGSTLIYYLRWNNAWFTKLSEYQFQKQRLDVDVLRASWTAEMLLEWVSEKEQVFPAELLSAYTTGLFRESRGTSEDHHPVNDLSHLIKRLSKVKVSSDGFEISSRK